MAERDTAESPPEQAVLTRRRRVLSPVWLVPLGALLIGAWLAWRALGGLGPEIVLQLDNAEGLEAGKTVVKLHDVEVGKVTGVRLSDDYDGVVATVRMEPEMAPLLAEDTDFWVVKPRVGRRGITGLSTIISGSYIQMRAGDSDRSRRRFTVLDQPPAKRPDVPGVSLVLLSDDDTSIAIDDPVLHQGQVVGRVVSARFDVSSRRTRYGIVVESPFDEVLTENTRFWIRSGVDLDVTAKGLDLRVGSLRTILSGGVAFGPSEGESVTEGDEYPLYASRSAAREARFDERIRYVALFDQSVHGLAEGAPVEFRGIRVGTVARVPFFHEGIRPDSIDDPSIPVLITFEPQRVAGAYDDGSRSAWIERLQRQFERGLRARIVPGNLLTGARYVSLEFVDDPAPVKVDRRAGYRIIPSGPGGGLQALQRKLAQLLDKLNGVPVDQLVQQLDSTLGNADRTLDDLRAAIDRLDRLLASDDVQQLPEQLTDTLRQLRRTLADYQAGEPVHDSLVRSLDRLDRVLKNLAPLSRTLRDRPNALIFGQDPRPDPVPGSHSR